MSRLKIPLSNHGAMNPSIRIHSIIGIVLMTTILSGSRIGTSTNTIQGTDFTTKQPTSTSAVFPQQELSCPKLICWIGIVPGLTTGAEATRLLTTHYGASNVTSNEGDISWENVGQEGDNGGRIRINEDRIVDEVDVYFAKERLTVEKFINRVGEPSFVYLVHAWSIETECAGAQIFYPDIGVIAWLYPIKGSVGVQPSQSIAEITRFYTEKAQYWEPTDTVKLAWRGYREYCKTMNQKQSEIF